MSAIQEFFKHQQELSARRKELEKKRRTMVRKPKVVVTEEVVDTNINEFSYYDSLLRRNWFVDDDLFMDLIWEAEQDVFDQIMENVETYPEYVRITLKERFAPERNSDKVKLKYKEMTDDDVFRIYQDNQREFEAKLEVVWQKFKAERGLCREENELDDKVLQLEENLRKTKKSLEDLMNAPKKYVAPSMRNKVNSSNDADKEKIRVEIRNIENEIAETKKQIKEEEEKWENGKKREYYDQLCESMQ